MGREKKKLDPEELEKLLEDGMTLVDIGRKYDCHPTTIGNFLYALDPRFRHIVKRNAKIKRKTINFTNPKNDGGGYKPRRHYEDGK